MSVVNDCCVNKEVLFWFYLYISLTICYPRVDCPSLTVRSDSSSKFNNIFVRPSLPINQTFNLFPQYVSVLASVHSYCIRLLDLDLCTATGHLRIWCVTDHSEFN